MDEARRVLERLERIEALDRAGVARTELLELLEHQRGWCGKRHHEERRATRRPETWGR